MHDNYHSLSESLKYTSIVEVKDKKGFMEKYYMLGFIFSLVFMIISLVLLCMMIISQDKPDLSVPQSSQIPIVGAYNDTIAGAAGVFGKNNHIPSPYYQEINIFNQKPTKTLLMFNNFKTYQQTSDYTCGPSSALMVLNYFGYTNISEKQLAEEAKTCVPGKVNCTNLGTTTFNLANAIISHGFVVEHNSGNPKNPFGDENGMKDFITESIKSNRPILAMTVDWGGHWEVIIGYDDMGTDDLSDDVIIIADPYDTTDHRQDGYAVWSMERFYQMWNVPMPRTIPGEEQWQYIRVSKP